MVFFFFFLVFCVSFSKFCFLKKQYISRAWPGCLGCVHGHFTLSEHGCILSAFSQQSNAVTSSPWNTSNLNLRIMKFIFSSVIISKENIHSIPLKILSEIPRCFFFYQAMLLFQWSGIYKPLHGEPIHSRIPASPNTGIENKVNTGVFLTTGRKFFIMLHSTNLKLTKLWRS